MKFGFNRFCHHSLDRSFSVCAPVAVHHADTDTSDLLASCFYKAHICRNDGRHLGTLTREGRGRRSGGGRAALEVGSCTFPLEAWDVHTWLRDDYLAGLRCHSDPYTSFLSNRSHSSSRVPLVCISSGPLGCFILCSPCCSGTHVDQAGLELMDLLVSAFQMLGLKALPDKQLL